uniref:Yos1-like protein n=1 Tax=Kwoniella dejecticola CBS 10117 TaxID=1296121 RepID=A0A1A6AHP4_9TREE|nr:uncharacterized protein I303_01361 [Kwoniella dejecticola CBS 10117]OBR89533.1 hypothetical protein I303_01361 [Kwoniella dejecticola CBS 10117]
MIFGYFGNLLYIGLLLTNAIAILNEERFLARTSTASTTSNAGFGQSPNPHMYNDAFGQGANDGPGVKAKLINLISATRTLMRLPLIVVNVVM